MVHICPRGTYVGGASRGSPKHLIIFSIEWYFYPTLSYRQLVNQSCWGVKKTNSPADRCGMAYGRHWDYIANKFWAIWCFQRPDAGHQAKILPFNGKRGSFLHGPTLAFHSVFPIAGSQASRVCIRCKWLMAAKLCQEIDVSGPHLHSYGNDVDVPADNVNCRRFPFCRRPSARCRRDIASVLKDKVGEMSGNSVKIGDIFFINLWKWIWNLLKFYWKSIENRVNLVLNILLSELKELYLADGGGHGARHLADRFTHGRWHTRFWC